MKRKAVLYPVLNSIASGVTARNTGNYRVRACGVADRLMSNMRRAACAPRKVAVESDETHSCPAVSCSHMGGEIRERGMVPDLEIVSRDMLYYVVVTISEGERRGYT
jgi:hypothetical protein